jgi:hypothetical protein
VLASQLPSVAKVMNVDSANITPRMQNFSIVLLALHGYPLSLWPRLLVSLTFSQSLLRFRELLFLSASRQ